MFCSSIIIAYFCLLEFSLCSLICIRFRRSMWIYMLEENSVNIHSAALLTFHTGMEEGADDGDELE